ncbi:MAG: hypothetical protein FRX49_02460 [Trebouxia sp. A1-2]|nr:MAG: hypothetical protein FRX49_02460 [Trebouxia sp. A1-2]
MNVLVLCLVSVSCLLSSVLTLTIVPARQRQPLASKLIVSMQRGGKKYPDGAAVPITPTQINTGSIIKARQHTLPVQVSLAPVHVQAASPPVLQSVQQPILQSTEAVKASEEVK